MQTATKANVRLSDVLRIEGWASLDKLSALLELARNAALENPDAVIVEIGVYAGRSLAALALGAQAASPTARTFGVDAFDPKLCAEGLADEHVAWRNQPDVKAAYAANKTKALQNLQRLGLNAAIIQDTSANACATWTHGPIDLLHIDGNHGEAGAMHDFTKWVALVRPGGTIIADDIDWPGVAAVTKALAIQFDRLFMADGEAWGVFKKPAPPD